MTERGSLKTASVPREAAAGPCEIPLASGEAGNGNGAMRRVVVFDLDGTLVDSMPMVLRAFAHALAPFRAPMSERELFLRLGAPPERAFHELLDDATHVPLALERMAEFSRTHWHLIQPFAGAQTLLAGLQTQGLAAALWTGRDRLSTEMILAEHGLAPAFATSVCGDDLSTHKPHPQGLLEILQRLRIQVADALFVGDADVDVLAGAGAGVRTVLIRHGREVDPAVLSKAWRVVETPGEAYACVQTEGEVGPGALECRDREGDL